MRKPIQRFSTGRPRTRAMRSWCSSSLKNDSLLAMTISTGIAIVDAGPQRGDAHQVIAVAQHRDRQAIAAAHRERRADRHAGAGADAAAAVEADVVQRMLEVGRARPASRAAGGCTKDVRGERLHRHARQIGERHAIRASPVGGTRPAPPRLSAARREPRLDRRRGRAGRARRRAPRPAHRARRAPTDPPAAAPDSPCSSRCGRTGPASTEMTLARGNVAVARLAQRAAEVDPVEAQDHVGVDDERAPRRPSRTGSAETDAADASSESVAPVLMSVSTTAPMRSASATRRVEVRADRSTRGRS